MKRDFDMTPQAILEYWNSPTDTSMYSRLNWNNSAVKYGQMELPTQDTSMAMRTMEKHGILHMGGTCLDVGCGAGRFSFAMEREGFQVTGTDFSPDMIAQCNSIQKKLGTHVTFSQDDWHSVDLKEKGWENAFDFVLCHMSPAICSGDSFYKLTRAAKKAVLMLRPARLLNSVTLQLLNLLNLQPQISEVDKGMAYAFSMTWLQGFCPETEFRDWAWDYCPTVDKAIADAWENLKPYGPISQENQQKVSDYLHNIADKDGIIHGETKVQIFSMFWRTDNSVFSNPLADPESRGDFGRI